MINIDHTDTRRRIHTDTHGYTRIHVNTFDALRNLHSERISRVTTDWRTTQGKSMSSRVPKIQLATGRDLHFPTRIWPVAFRRSPMFPR